MTKAQEQWMLHMNELTVKPWKDVLPKEFAILSIEAGRRMKKEEK